MLHGCQRPGLSPPKEFRGRSINLHFWRLQARRQVASCSTAPRLPNHEIRDPEYACRLFDELAREHCPVVRVSLAYFGPKGGFGWRRLRNPTCPPPPTLAASPPWRKDAAASTLPASASPSGSDSTLPTAIPTAIPTTSNVDLAGRKTAVETILAADSDEPAHLQTQAQSHVTPDPPSPSPGPRPGFKGDPITLLSVPLSLCLSAEIPGCCPPARTSPALTAIFAAGGLPWEIQIAATLVWACRLYLNTEIQTNAAITSAAEEEEKCPTMPYGYGSLMHAGEDGGGGEGATNGGVDRTTRAGSRSGNADGNNGAAGGRGAVAGSGGRSRQGGGSGGLHVHTFADFWRHYQVLLPAVESQSTLLFFSEEELQQLQDPHLAEEAFAWQHEVLRAYDMWINTPTFRAEVGEVPLREWLRAVGAVESRAFGFRSAEDGRELHAYVPFFCLANYRPGAPTLHLLRATRGPEEPTQPEQGPPRPEASQASQPQEPEWGLANPLRGGSPPSKACRQVATADMVAWQEDATATATTTAESASGVTETATKPAGEAAETADEPASGAIAALGGLKDQQLQRWRGPDGKQDQDPRDHRQRGKLQQGPRPRRPHQKHQHRQHIEAEQQQLQPLEAQAQEGLEQVFIDYGRKDNRSLVYQYGFVLYGNPYDRLGWDGLELDAGCRMRRDWVYDTAERLARELATMAMTAAADAEAEEGNGSASVVARSTPAAPEAGVKGRAEGCSVRRAVGGGAGSSDRGCGAEVEDRAEGHLADSGLMGGWEAARTRFRSAAASVVAASGWRNLRERRQVTPASELRSLTALTEWVDGQLRAFPTSLDHDLRLLRQLQEQGPADAVVATASPAVSFATPAVVGVGATALDLAVATAARREGDRVDPALMGVTASAAIAAPGAMEGAAESVPPGSSLVDTPCDAVLPELGGTGDIHVVQGSVVGGDGVGRCGAGRHVGALAGGNCMSVQGSGPEAGTADNDTGGVRGESAGQDAARGRLREAVGWSAARGRVALEYRVERKLMAQAMLRLLRRLREVLEAGGA